jgi:hypothetical protein
MWDMPTNPPERSVDSRNRISLSGVAKHDRYRIERLQDERILLTPLISVPATVVDRHDAPVQDREAFAAAKPPKFVGEAGPEIARPRKGAKVLPLDRSDVDPRFKKGGKS